ncbi:MAG: FHA domain-containing protein [Planctomycetota bacterium]
MQTRTDVLSGSGPRAKLVFRSGPSRGKVLELNGDTVTIGRDARSDVVIRDDIISSRHIRVGGSGEDIWIEDLGSKNGTFINGKQVDGRIALREGDILCLALSGPELQLTFGKPKLPSILKTCTSTLSRSGTLSALREIFPSGSRGAVSVSGVRAAIDAGLERASRKSRHMVLAMSGAVLVVLMALVGMQIAQYQREADATDPAEAVRELASRVELDLKLDSIYGSLFHSYRDRALGSVRITNESDDTLEGASLVFGMSDRAKLSNLLVEDLTVEVPALSKGQSWSAELKAVLANAVLLPVDREVTASIRLLIGGTEARTITRAVNVFGQNAIDWRDPRQVAAFVDANDPVVQSFVNQVWAKSTKSKDEVPPENLVKAATLITAVASRGLRYLSDGRSATFTGMKSESGSAIVATDSVKYPGQTLRDQTGDCDDLSVLCCAMLQAVDVETAFLVAPDHVFFMFDSGLESLRSDQTPFPSESVVDWSGRVWIPIESTALGDTGASFGSAWTRAWKRAQQIGKGVTVVPIQEAWRSYRPFRPPADAGTVRYAQETKWIDGDGLKRVAKSLKEIADLYEGKLEERIREIEEAYNGLERAQEVGVFYTQSGLFSKARKVLGTAVFGEPVPDTLESLRTWSGSIDEDRAILLGELATSVALVGELELAAAYYVKSVDHLIADEDKAEVYLHIALLHHSLGELASAKTWIVRAGKINSGYQDRFVEITRGDGSVASERPRILVELWRRVSTRQR